MKCYGLFIFIIIVMVSCENDQKELAITNTTQDSLSLDDHVNSKKTIQVTLQEEPKQLVAVWLAFITAQDEMNNLENATLQDVVDKAPTLSKIMTELKGSIPSNLASNAVLARIVVLETKAKILEQLTKRQSLDLVKMKSIANEMPQDFENFKLQLNELFLKTPDEFEIELDDRLDSIQKANELKPGTKLIENNLKTLEENN